MVRVAWGVYDCLDAHGERYFRVDFYGPRAGKARARIRERCDGTKTDAIRLRRTRDLEVRNGAYVHPEDAARAAEDAKRAAEAAESQRVTVSAYCDTFLSVYGGRKRSDHYPDCLKYLRARLGDRVLSDVTRADLDGFAAALQSRAGLKGRPLGPSSRRKILSVTKTLFKWAVERGDLEASPAVGLKKPPEPKSRTRYLSDDEWTALDSTAPPWLRPILTLAVNTGMRRSEIALLTWRDVDLKAAMLHVPQDTKTGTRPVPLNADARAVLDDRDRARREIARRTGRLPLAVFTDESGADYSTDKGLDAITKATIGAMRAAGIADAKLHDLRHTAASWMVRAGVPLYEVGKILGHSTPMMTQRYAHLAPEHLRRAVSVLESARRAERARDFDTTSTRTPAAGDPTEAPESTPSPKSLRSQ